MIRKNDSQFNPSLKKGGNGIAQLDLSKTEKINDQFMDVTKCGSKMFCQRWSNSDNIFFSL